MKERQINLSDPSTQLARRQQSCIKKTKFTVVLYVYFLLLSESSGALS